MKNIKMIFGVLALIIVSSCGDARNISSVDSIGEDNAFTTVADLQQGLNSATLGYSPEAVISFSSRFTDDLRFGGDTGGQGANDIQQQLNINAGSTIGIWNGRYRVITDINTFLPFAESFEAVDSNEQQQINSIIGQSLALRALAHLDLMALYSAGATVNDLDIFASGNLAVPIITDVDTFGQPRRATVAEVAAFITEDLNRASSLLGNPTDNDFITQQAITAIRARLALYTGDYPGAMNAANNLIGQFPLANTTQYFNMFRDDTDETEVIWSLIRNQAAGPNTGGLFFFTNSFGSFFEVSNGLINAIPSGDIREGVIIDLVDAIGNGQDRVGKYLGRPGENGRNNVKVFRVSEQYLIRAEAQARMGNLAGAAASVDALVDARFGSDQPTPVYGNLEDAIRDILFQRRLELAYEGHRYIDLRRTRDITGDGIERDPGLGVPGESDDCGTRGVPCSLAFNDQRFSFPIPNSELAGNPGITQNPGY